MNTKNSEDIISISKFLQIDLIGKVFYYGDNNFGESHNGYHLYGKVQGCEFKKDTILLNLEWVDILYNDTHGSDDWIPGDPKYKMQIIKLLPTTELQQHGTKIFIRSIKPLKNRRKNIDWTFIYFDLAELPISKAKYLT